MLSRAPAAHRKTTGRPAAHSKTTGGRAPWEHPVQNSRRGGRARTPVEDDLELSTGETSTWKELGRRAPENIDLQNTGRVAREQADFGLFQHPAKRDFHSYGLLATDRLRTHRDPGGCSRGLQME